MNLINKDNRRAGFYWVEDKPYASVTSILKVIDKSDALLTWAAKETYYAMVKDPNISEDKAVRAHVETRDAAASRGSTIHSLLEVYRTSGEVVSTLPIHQGYYQAFKSWVEKSKPNFLKQEETLVDHELRIAGTYDGLVEINGKTYLIDFKTNREGRLFPEVELQLSAYLHMARKTQNVDGILAVGLAEDGKFNELYCVDRFDVFLHVFELWKWKEKERLEKVGYER